MDSPPQVRKFETSSGAEIYRLPLEAFPNFWTYAYLVFAGDMRVLIRHADLVNVLYDVYSREVDTSWPRGKPPYDGN